MYFLFLFFVDLQRGDDCMEEAVERGLGSQSDAELLNLRDVALAFAQRVETEYLGRAIAADVTPECDVNGCVLARGHNSDHLFDLEIGSRGETALEMQ